MKSCICWKCGYLLMNYELFARTQLEGELICPKCDMVTDFEDYKEKEVEK